MSTPLAKVGTDNMVAHIRASFNTLYPEVNDPPHVEHPMTAVGVVLLYAVIRGTTDINTVVRATGYSLEFISAIAFNMQNNDLWVGGNYEKTSSWLSSEGICNDRFWEHIEVACRELWLSDAASNRSVDTCKIYWDERPNALLAVFDSFD